MLRLVVIALVLVWAGAAHAEEKIPDGFGPVKFGMTKEQAEAALDGKGEWNRHRRTIYHTYDLQLPDLRIRTFAVAYVFRRERVTAAFVTYREEGVTYSICLERMLYFAGLIEAIYERRPLRENDVFEFEMLKYHETNYYFVFPNGAFIYVTGQYDEDGGKCVSRISYEAARISPLPF